eukprot:gnl/TRDRNA2_/TRDRNA2_82903_c0_seq1.p1 gnl/TRDRNA2_/TRDRNA2_82903_c0~~gnl/TRDRNA2_/TRDRNA2_82903_c0_seq1.p1  ORF type:complete len:321 (-),score=46.72 gnl/TRDRNA2_/TRDRNA2_82903_c0_seq1:502-1371(-)
MEDIIELTSSTSKKFSNHVIVRNERDHKESNLSMAFQNNAQVGVVVNQFVDWLEVRRSSDPGDPANILFVRQPGTDALTSVIDTSVYSRNRCFRLLFNSKLDKAVPLRYERGGRLDQKDPDIKLLNSMATFVPEGTPMFEHSSIAADVKHKSFKLRRQPDPIRTKEGNFTAGQSPVADAVLAYMLSVWDEMRNQYEPDYKAFGATYVSSCLEVGENATDARVVVTLANNRFCLCKGASHKSNNIFLLVDILGRCFYQKCHDADCGHFRSVSFPFPEDMLLTKPNENRRS